MEKGEKQLVPASLTTDDRVAGLAEYVGNIRPSRKSIDHNHAALRFGTRGDELEIQSGLKRTRKSEGSREKRITKRHVKKVKFFQIIPLMN